MSARLAGKRCLIVGGTSGIGLAIAKRFLEEQAQVVIAGLDEGHAGPGLKLIVADVTKAAEVDRLFNDAVQELGGLDILCHTAGGSGRRHGDGAIHECSEAGWQATLELNLTSVFLTNRAAIRHFLARSQPGVILNVSSILALSPAPEYFDTCAYVAAKGGIISLSRHLAARYAAQRIRVNVLAPGLVDTPMSQRATSDPTIQQWLQGKQPLIPGPLAPDDCAAAAAYLCSDEARGVTGSVHVVDGGWSVAP